MNIPPWIQAANPADHLTRGLQIGMQMGAQQAAQQFQQQQEARHEQLMAQEQARFQAEHGLQEANLDLRRQQMQQAMTLAAGKHAAMQEYRQRVGAGEDPLKVLMEVGPAAGLPGSMEAAAIRSQRMATPAKIVPPSFIYADINGRKVPVALQDQMKGSMMVLPHGLYSDPAARVAAISGPQKEALRELRKERDTLLKNHDPVLDASLGKTPEGQASILKDRTRLADIAKQIGGIINPPAGAATPGATAVTPEAAFPPDEDPNADPGLVTDQAEPGAQAAPGAAAAKALRVLSISPAE